MKITKNYKSRKLQFVVYEQKSWKFDEFLRACINKYNHKKDNNETECGKEYKNEDKTRTELKASDVYNLMNRNS